jgi:hypothetical protein
MSDYLLSPQRHSEQAQRSWSAVQRFVNRLTARERSLRALCIAFDGPQMFKAQLFPIYDYTLALLDGFNNVEV